MDPNLLVSLEKVLDDVIDVLNEAGWDDEGAWYADLREVLLTHEPGSPQFTEMLVELEQSFFGMGSFMDIPLATTLQSKLEEVSSASANSSASNAQDTHQQRLGLVSCASGIIQSIKKSAK